MEREELDANFINIKSLADFLNFDFGIMDRPTLEGIKHQYGQWPISLAASLWTWEPEDPEATSNASNLQRELQRDLSPIIPPAKVDNPTEAYRRISKLFTKLNEVGLKTGWSVDPIEHRWAPIQHSHGFGAFELIKTVPGKKRKTPHPSFSLQPAIEILGYKWLLGRLPEEFSTTLSREKLYLVILDALERYELARLKKCHWEPCGKFFLADPPVKNFCCQEHQLEDHKTEAAMRKREQQTEREETKQRKTWPASERKSFTLFLKRLRESRSGKVAKSPPANAKLIIEALDKWEKGASLNAIWLGYDAEAKEIFQVHKKKTANRGRKASRSNKRIVKTKRKS